MSEDHKKKIEEQQKEERKKIAQEKKDKQRARDQEKKEAKERHERGEADRREDLKQAEDRIRSEEKRRPYKTSMGIRALNFVIGLALLLSPIYIFLNSVIVLDTAILIFAVIILLSGVARFFNAFYDKEIGGTKRIIRAIIGVSLIIIAVLAFFRPNIGVDLLITFFAIAITFQGIGRVMLGLGHDTYPFWLKITMITLGLISIIIAISAFTSLAIGSFEIQQSNLIRLFAAAFFIGGISRIGQSLAGLKQRIN